MKHLFLSVLSFFHYPKPTGKPALQVKVLDRALEQFKFDEQDSLVCVYPVERAEIKPAKPPSK
jgi:hypothetical protein